MEVVKGEGEGRAGPTPGPGQGCQNRTWMSCLEKHDTPLTGGKQGLWGATLRQQSPENQAEGAE